MGAGCSAGCCRRGSWRQTQGVLVLRAPVRCCRAVRAMLSQCSVFSAELVAAATCCCVRCYRSMPSHRGVKSIRLRSYARIACSLDSLDSPQPPFRLRQPSPPPTSPPAGAARHDSEASGLNPHDAKVARRRRHIYAYKYLRPGGGHRSAPPALARSPALPLSPMASDIRP